MKTDHCTQQGGPGQDQGEVRLTRLGGCGLPVRHGRGCGRGEAAGRCLGQQETRRAAVQC